MNRYPLLTYIALFSMVIPICAGISKITTVDRGMKILFLFLLFAFTADIYLMWFVKGHQLHLGLLHLYYLVEYVFVMSIVFLWQESKRMKRFTSNVNITLRTILDYRKNDI